MGFASKAAGPGFVHTYITIPKHRKGFPVSPKSFAKTRFFLATALLLGCVGCDQITKNYATQSLQGEPPVSMCADTVRLCFALNPGGFLSVGSQLPDEIRRHSFIAMNVGLMFGLALFMLFKRDLPLSFFLALILVLSGGIGNLIDRIWNNGLVTDFINLGIGPLRTGIFNVADVALMLGAAGVAYHSWRRGQLSQAPSQSH